MCDIQQAPQLKKEKNASITVGVCATPVITKATGIKTKAATNGKGLKRK